MTTKDFNYAVLALEGWREAGEHAPLDTVMCVAYTIYNLAMRDEIGVGAAVLKHREMHGLTAPQESYPDERDPKFAKLLQRISDIGSPFAEDLTNGAVYYLDLAKPVPEHLAFLLKSPDDHPRVASCGTKHYFK